MSLTNGAVPVLGQVPKTTAIAVFPLNERWQLTEDGQLQWILQRKRLKVKHERSAWASKAFCTLSEGILDVALPHHGIIPTDAACNVLGRLPARDEPGALERAIGEIFSEAA